MTPGEPDDRAVENMRGQLFKGTEITLDLPTKIVGNNGGMALLQEVRQLTSELEKSKAEHERQIQSMASRQADHYLPEHHIVTHGSRLRLDIGTIQSREPHYWNYYGDSKRIGQYYSGMVVGRMASFNTSLPFTLISYHSMY